MAIAAFIKVEPWEINALDSAALKLEPAIQNWNSFHKISPTILINIPQAAATAAFAVFCDNLVFKKANTIHISPTIINKGVKTIALLPYPFSLKV